MDKSSDALDAATYFAALHKRINGGRMPNSLVGSLLGQNITSSQASMMSQGNSGQLGLANNAAQWNPSANIVKGTIKPMYPDVRNDRLELFFKVTQAENGFIVGISNHYGDVVQPHIATTMEDVTTIVTSQLASRMLDRTEQ
jgi:hypothetical protein